MCSSNISYTQQHVVHVSAVAAALQISSAKTKHINTRDYINIGRWEGLYYIVLLTIGESVKANLDNTCRNIQSH